MAAESGGRTNAKNPRSSALGPFQFIKSTFLDVARRHFLAEIAGLTEEKILELRTDPGLSRRVAAVFCRESVNYLKEQGLAPTHWEASHAGAFAANLVLFAVIAPFVEELTFRGAGQSLLHFLGRMPSILLVGLAFGLAHGLVEALLVLVPFGVALAWLRDRTNSVLPGMLVHAFFNATALVLAVLG